MGFKKPLDYNQVQHQIYMSGVELHSPHNDGYTQWEIKKDLYKIKWLVDSILENSDSFLNEDEFIDEHKQKIMWQILKR